MAAHAGHQPIDAIGRQRHGHAACDLDRARRDLLVGHPCVIEHAHHAPVGASAAARAVFKDHVREARLQAAIQLIKALDLPHGAALAPPIAHSDMEILLRADVIIHAVEIEMIVLDDARCLRLRPVNHSGIGEIQIARRRFAVHMARKPLGVLGKRATVFAHALDLHPKAELHAQLPAIALDFIKAVRIALGIGNPVARERMPVGLPVRRTIPARIHDEHLRAGARHLLHELLRRLDAHVVLRAHARAHKAGVFRAGQRKHALARMVEHRVDRIVVIAVNAGNVHRRRGQRLAR